MKIKKILVDPKQTVQKYMLLVLPRTLAKALFSGDAHRYLLKWFMVRSGL